MSRYILGYPICGLKRRTNADGLTRGNVSQYPLSMLRMQLRAARLLAISYPIMSPKDSMGTPMDGNNGLLEAVIRLWLAYSIPYHVESVRETPK